MTWEIVIGLEVHTQLSTKTKIFSGASTEFGAEPNTQADAVSIALPGVLPVLNKGAVERAIRFALAIGTEPARRSVFARKNYFYPDLPKGYQISQMDLPVVGKGALIVQVEPLSGNAEPYEITVNITRAHLEEDAGKSMHGDFHGMTGIDLNRAGTPLLEIVSEPDMANAAEAVAYAKALHKKVCWNGICDGNMQEGSFRCDVNVSVRKPGQPLGTRREIKNLNSFKFMQQAIDYEVQWQIDTIENGGKVQQATVLFNPDTGETRAMRSKEDAHDYRYFPDPDLLPLEISSEWIEQVRSTLPEQSEAKQSRYVNDLGLSAYDASVLTSSREMAEYFEICVANVGEKHAKLCANWIMGEISARLNKEGLDISACPVPADSLAQLLNLIVRGETNENIAKKTILPLMWEQGKQAVPGTFTLSSPENPEMIVMRLGLKQVSDTGEIEKIVDEVIAANADKVAEYRSGKDKLFGFFVGLAMKASKGKANPAQLNDILKKRLEG